MQVTGTRAERLVLRTRQQTADAGGIDCVLVSIATDVGLTGYGEAVPGFEYTGETAETVDTTIVSLLGPSILGRSPFDTEKIVADWRTTVDGHRAARAAVEMALWDLQGKAAGRPLHELIGRRARETMPETYPFDRVEQPEQAFERARALRVGGVQVFKVYLTVGDPPVLDPRREAIVEAVRDGAGRDVEIRVDANGGWSDIATAVASIRRLERSGISWIEEPMRGRDFVACRTIRARASTPVCLDESVPGASRCPRGDPRGGLRHHQRQANEDRRHPGGPRAQRDRRGRWRRHPHREHGPFDGRRRGNPPPARGAVERHDK